MSAAFRGGKQQRHEEDDIEDVEDDDQMMHDDEMDADEMDFPVNPNFFWHAQLKTDGETDLQQPAIHGFVIHITKACFGVNVKAGSRTVVLVKDEESKQEIPLCVLTEGKNESENLNLIISENLTFQLKGKNVSPVTLTGYIAPPPNEFDDEGAMSMDDDMGEMEEVDDELPASVREAILRKRKLQQARAEDDDEAPQLEEEKDSIEPPNKRAKTDANNNKNKQPQAQNNTNNNNNNKKQAQNQNQNKNNNTNTNEQKPKENTTTNNNNNNANASEEKPLSKSQKKKQAKAAKKAGATGNDNNPGSTSNNNNNNEENKEEADKKSPKNAPNQSPKDTPIENNSIKKVGDFNVMKNGLKYKDLKEGDGPEVKSGQEVAVYYVGQLANKDIFDKNISGEGFLFHLGKGDVIKGWDEGIKGMKVGGKRRLVVPANLAYGKQGTDNIPPNSELTFTVEVRKVNA